MASAASLEKASALLSTMSPSDLDIIIERALIQRGLRFYALLDLPPELRNRVYYYAITETMIRRHVQKGECPALLKVTKQISTEFSGLYYSRESMRLEFYDGASSEWFEEKDTKICQSILADHPSFGMYGSLRYDGRSNPREFIISMHRLDNEGSDSPQYRCSPPGDNERRGVLVWGKASDGAEAECYYRTDAVEDTRLRRY